MSAARHVSCQDCPLRRRRLFRPFTEEELAFVAAMKTGHVAVAARADVLQAGQVGVPLMTLFEGWAVRYRRLANDERQILAILLPGDLVGAEGAVLGRIEHSVLAVTPVTLCVLDGSSLAHLFARFPDWGGALYRNGIEEGRWRDTDQIVRNRMSAVQRVAHFFLDTADRLRQRGGANGGALCPFPLTRVDLADAVGLSAMHLSRTLAELKRQGLASLGGGTLYMPDRDRLRRLLQDVPRSDHGEAEAGGDAGLRALL